MNEKDIDELQKRINDIKMILDLRDDNIPISLIPNEYCDVEPFCTYKATFQKENNSIFINHNALKNDSLEEMTMHIAHELYHAYQYKNEPTLFDTQETQNYHLVGLNYVKQPLEIQAYAFQIAIAMLYCEQYIEFEMKGVDSITTKKINELAEKYYQKYKDRFIEVVNR